MSHNLWNVSYRTLFSYVKALTAQSLFHSPLHELNVWILHEINLLHAILFHDRGNIDFQTSFEEFQVSQCATSCFACLLLFLHHRCCQNRISSVALFRLPDKLSEFNNIGSLTGILHVTSPSIQNALISSSSNFDILEISSYVISLKVAFSLLSTVNLFNLNEFVRIDVFNRETRAENWFWKAFLSSLHFKSSKSSAISGALSY